MQGELKDFQPSAVSLHMPGHLSKYHSPALHGLLCHDPATELEKSVCHQHLVKTSAVLWNIADPKLLTGLKDNDFANTLVSAADHELLSFQENSWLVQSQLE